MKYEIEFVNLGFDKGMASLFCTLTGLDKEEILPLMKDRLKGSDFKRIFRKLGFNTNDRFIKFDPETKYPVVLRLQGKQKGYWYAFAYYDGQIYDPWNNRILLLDADSEIRKLKGKYFIQKNWFYGETLRITSMLQVWI